MLAASAVIEPSGYSVFARTFFEVLRRAES